MAEQSRGVRESSLTLVVRRTIQATPERVFQAWTNPEQMQKWWGTQEIACTGTEIDLRVGGAYRIGNKLPNGQLLWITGEFEKIEPPGELVFSWRVEGRGNTAERVTVRFEPRGKATEVIVTHERIPDSAIRDQHEYGWRGCLEGLAHYLETV